MPVTSSPLLRSKHMSPAFEDNNEPQLKAATSTFAHTLRGTTVALTNSSSGERASAAFIEEQLREELGHTCVLNLIHYVRRRVDPYDNKPKEYRRFKDKADWEAARPDPVLSTLLDKVKGLDGVGNVIVAGGDGTIAWGMQLLDAHFDKEPIELRPYVAIIPMGTGNDLSRSLGFGGGFVRENCCCCCPLAGITHILHDIEKAHRTLLDRWLIQVFDKDGNEVKHGQDVMSNYLSIGLDAEIAHNFDAFRRDNPKLCKSRALNKLWYARFGIGGLCGTPYLGEHVAMEVDGKKVDPKVVKGLKNVILTNIDSFGAGMKIWRDSKKPGFDQASFYDGKLEVCGYHGTWHMAMGQSGMRSSTQVAQGSKIKLTLSAQAALKMQVDGEPVSLPKGGCTVIATTHPCGAHKVLTKHLKHHVVAHSPDSPASATPRPVVQSI